jgi:hypothetical protein
MSHMKNLTQSPTKALEALLSSCKQLLKNANPTKSQRLAVAGLALMRDLFNHVPNDQKAKITSHATTVHNTIRHCSNRHIAEKPLHRLAKHKNTKDNVEGSPSSQPRLLIQKQNDRVVSNKKQIQTANSMEGSLPSQHRPYIRELEYAQCISNDISTLCNTIFTKFQTFKTEMNDRSLLSKEARRATNNVRITKSSKDKQVLKKDPVLKLTRELHNIEKLCELADTLPQLVMNGFKSYKQRKQEGRHT